MQAGLGNLIYFVLNLYSEISHYNKRYLNAKNFL